MKNFFTADTHFDHENCLNLVSRSIFTDIVTYNETVLEGINATVAKGDRLFILGDVAWYSVDNYLDRIVCKDVHLIWGNHDRPGFGKKFRTSQDTLIVRSNGKKFFLSHYPHAYWPSSHRGSFHLYGHCHRQREGTLDTLFPGRRSMDCGIDSAKALLGSFRPFGEPEVMEILGGRPGHDDITFYEQFEVAKVSQ